MVSANGTATPGFCMRKAAELGNERERFVEHGIATLLLGSDTHQVFRGGVGGETS